MIGNKKNPLLKCLLIGLSLITISCSNETTVGSAPKGPANPGDSIDDNGFRLTLQSWPSYTNEEFFRVFPFELNETDERVFKSVQFWTGSADCTGDIAGYSGRTTFTDPNFGAQIQLEINKENLLSYLVEYESGDTSDCEIAGVVIHDGVSPGPVSPDQAAINTNEASIHIPLSDIADDAHEIDVFINGSSTKSHTLNAAVWRNGLGFITVPENQATSYVFQVRDYAGNTSTLSSAVVVTHDTEGPAAPELSLATVELGNGVVTTPQINVIGTVDADTTEVLVYLNSLYSAPVATVSKTDFEAGINLSLVDESVNVFYFVAKDALEAMSPQTTLSINAIQNPVYEYDLLSQSIFSDSPAIVNVSSPLSVLIHNASVETTLNAFVPVTSFSATESSSYITLDTTRGCFTDSLTASGACELFFTANYPTTGVKNETLQVGLNGTTIPVNLEIEVVSVEMATLSSASLTALGSFEGMSLNGANLIFANGIVTTDLSVVTLDASLAENIKTASLVSGYRLIGVKDGKIYSVEEDLTIKQFTSTRTYDPGSIKAIAERSSGVVVVVDNGSGSQDILIEDNGEILDQTVSSNLASGNDCVYYRSGTSLMVIDQGGDLQAISGISIVGDLASQSGYVVTLGNSGSGNSLHKIVALGHENLNLISGATSFSHIANGVFAFENAGSHGVYSGGVIASNGTQSPIPGDIKTFVNNDGEIFSSVKLQTGAGSRLIISKYLEAEDSVIVGDLDASVYGNSIGGVVFDKDGDYLLMNRSTPSVVLSRGGETSYSAIADILTTPTPNYSKVVTVGTKAIFTNLVSGKYQLNTISTEEVTPFVTLGYFTPSDINLGAEIEIYPVNENSVLIYYPTATGMQFKTIAIY